MTVRVVYNKEAMELQRSKCRSMRLLFEGRVGMGDS